MSDVARRAALAERAARAGGAVARDAFRTAVRIETKADKNDIVTAADHRSQRQVVATITEEFADEPLVCEEVPEGDVRQVPGGGTPPREGAGEFLNELPAEGPCWVVDPIDGTANFARGLRLWGAVVACVQDCDPVAAATYLPAVQDVYTVGEDEVTRNGDPIEVSDRDDPETSAVALVARWERDRSALLGAVSEAINERYGDSRRFGSLQATLAFVASGEIDAAVTTEPTTPWDSLAGVALIRAAGGTVTGLDGDAWTLDSEGLIATNGEVHEALRSTVADAAASHD